jgi:UDP-N-acetylmuramate--alanine ligase
VDVLVLADVYPAGEQPIPAADGRSLAHALRVVGKTELVFVEDIAEMAETLLKMANDGDIVMTMGAGSIANVPAQLQQLTAQVSA